MTHAIIPDRLFGLIVRSLGLSPAPNWNDFEAEEGPVIRHRKGTKPGLRYNGTVRIDKEDADNFWFFYRETLVDGTLEFWGTDPRTGERRLWYFEQEPQEAALGGNAYDIQMALRRIR